MGASRDIAVAVGYSPGMPAPVVLAKGRGRLAALIRDIAARAGVAVVPEPDLARGLLEIDPGTFIPEEYYRIIAEILVFVGRVGAAGGRCPAATGEEVTQG